MTVRTPEQMAAWRWVRQWTGDRLAQQVSTMNREPGRYSVAQREALTEEYLRRSGPKPPTTGQVLRDAVGELEMADGSEYVGDPVALLADAVAELEALREIVRRKS